MPTESFSAQGYRDEWVVPAGVSSATFRLFGAGGAAGAETSGNGGHEGAGSNGGYAEFTTNVSPGETYYLYVGEGGSGDSGGWPDGGDGGVDSNDYYTMQGGGGGGRTDVRSTTSSSDIIAIAGGGGGGGAARDVQNDSGATAGGDGGGSSGESAADAGFADGGSAGGTGCGGPTGSGGNGTSNVYDFEIAAGGGGGGGYCGGGGGEGTVFNDYSYGSGGGGGSGAINAGYSTTLTQGGGNSNDGLIEIEYSQAPADPQNVTQSVVGDDDIDVTWDENTNGGPVDDYDVEVSEDGSAYTTVSTSITTESYAYTADPSVNTHQFRVRANNSDGSSGYSHTETVATDPTNLQLTSITQSEITLDWDTVRGATSYEILRAESSGSVPADYTPIATPNAPPYNDSQLENGEQFYYRVRAVYAGTNSQPTSEANATTPLPAPLLDSLSASTVRELTLSYTLNDDSSDGGVTIERSDDAGTTWATVTTITNLNATEYTDTGLLDGEEYTYRLIRETDHASAQSGTKLSTTILPAPTSLETGAIGDESIDITWSATHNNGDTRVEFRRDDSGGWTTDSTVAHDTEQAAVGGLLNGQLYGVRVVAQTDHAETEDE